MISLQEIYNIFYEKKSKFIYELEILKWKLMGKPMISYKGFRCMNCDKWVDKPFMVPTYLSLGEIGDTWNYCDECNKNLFQSREGKLVKLNK